MNSFGRLFRVSIFGESHGASVGVLLDGVPAGIDLNEEDFTKDLLRRKASGLGTTPRIEEDKPIIETGVFNGKTTGAPILIRFLNQNTRSKDYSNLVTHPRPSHADYTGHVKYKGFNDYRGGGAFSGRLTLAIVAAGVVAKKICPYDYKTSIVSLHGEANKDKYEEILKNAIQSHDSVGGVVEIRINKVPVGLGEPYFDSVESILGHLLFSVGGVKGVEFGIGFEGAKLYGSEFNDLIVDGNGQTKTNNNGGINGGIANGNEIVVRVMMKPTPSIGVAQNTYDFKEGKVTPLEITGRHDAAIILRGQVVLEAMCAIGLCDLYMVNRGILGEETC